jgi:cobalt-zinc-cadmium efflux system membrane fusion protein
MKTACLLLALSVPLAACRGQEPAAPPSKTDVNVIEMGLDAQKNAGVTVAPAAIVKLVDYLHVAGTVQPIDSRSGSVRSLARGRVQDVLVHVGDRVEAGQPLAHLDNIEAGELRSQYATAKADWQKLNVQAANAARHLDRSRSLAGIGATSQRDLELAESEHAAYVEALKAQESVIAGLDGKLRRFGLSSGDLQSPSLTTIVSPFAGVVIQAEVAPGDVVDPGVALFSITNLSEVWVQAEVYEKDLGRIQLGQSAVISVDTYPGETFAGRVAYVSDVLDPKTRTAQVRCVVPNRDRRMKLDMFVSVDLPTTASRTALAVPASALQNLDGKPVMFVRKSNQQFEVREVKVGLTTGGHVEILSGVRETEPVVVQGAYQLKSIRMSSALGEG